MGGVSEQHYNNIIIQPACIGRATQQPNIEGVSHHPRAYQITRRSTSTNNIEMGNLWNPGLFDKVKLDLNMISLTLCIYTCMHDSYNTRYIQKC